MFCPQGETASQLQLTETRWECIPGVARLPVFQEKVELWIFMWTFLFFKPWVGQEEKLWVCGWVLSAGRRLQPPKCHPWFSFTTTSRLSQPHYPGPVTGAISAGWTLTLFLTLLKEKPTFQSCWEVCLGKYLHTCTVYWDRHEAESQWAAMPVPHKRDEMMPPLNPSLWLCCWCQLGSFLPKFF